MDNRLQATFMPRQTVGAGGYPGQKGRQSVFLLIGVLVFGLVVAMYGGLYGYKVFITKSNEEKKVQVEKAIKDFEPELTQKLTLIKNRIEAAKTLLDNHKAVSLLFSLLELNTVQVLRFSDVSYSYMPDTKKIAIAMKGESRSYNAIAYQSDVFSKIDQLSSPIFSNLAITESGLITFDFNAELDTNAVMYKNLFTNFTLPAATTTPATATSTSATSTPARSTSTGTSTPPRATSTPPRATSTPTT